MKKLKDDLFEILFQEPVLRRSFSFKVKADQTISEIAEILKVELGCNDNPVFFCYTDKKRSSNYSKMVTEGLKVFLSEEMQMHEIILILEHKDPPVVYFKQLTLSEKELFLLRTDRTKRMGYDPVKLAGSHIFIGGGGLLGNEIISNLAVMGIGEITVIDSGHIDWVNIYRQSLFDEKDVYKKKAEVIKEKIENIGNIKVNSLINKVPYRGTQQIKKEIVINLNIIDKFLRKSDVIIGAFDIASARAVLQILAKYRGIPFIHAGLIPGKGEVGLFLPDSRGCYCCPWQEVSFMDGGACTLATIDGQKFIGGITSRITADILNGKNIKTEKILYDPQTFEITKNFNIINTRCVICSGQNIQNFSFNEITDLIINWLFPVSENKD